MSKFFRHLGTILKHKHHVFWLCCKCGLFWRGLVHDLSKFTPTEFFESVKYCNGKRSPLDTCRETNGYSKAWLHHKGRNKHHIEYWYDYDCTEQPDMPYKYAVESICDRIAANKTYKGKNYNQGDPLKYWLNNVQKLRTNERMINFFTKVLSDLEAHGEKFILNKKYMKKTYKEIVEQNKH